MSRNLNHILFIYKLKSFFKSFISVKVKEFVLFILGPPDPPRNCTLTNQTHDSLQVDCQEGFGSGLSQEFHMEVFTDLQLLVNITARSPRLVARGLPPGQVLFLRVYASNTKGRSRSVRIDGYTLRMADKRPGKIG